MDEIKVGEYIRFGYGEIGIVKYYNGINIGIITQYGETEISSGVDKIAKDIIDLIEVGDIVNGCVVVAEKYTYIEMNFINVDSEISYGWGTGAIPENEIKTILTHEQYEQNCYKVGED